MADLQVVVRARPLSDDEESNGSRCCVSIISSNTIIVGNTQTFHFDAVFGYIAEQDDIYSDAISPTLHKLFSGENCTIIAFGQSGSGKTYTLGTDYHKSSSTKGILSLMLNDIFERITSENNTRTTVQISLLEFDGKDVYPLITCENQSVYEDPETELSYLEPKYIEVHNEQEALWCLEKGCKALQANVDNTTGIFVICLKRELEDGSIQTSKMHIIDAASFEVQRTTSFAAADDMSNRFCHVTDIVAAVSGDKHVIQQDTSLKHLNEYLGESNFVVLIACISSADKDLVETVTTLRFANHMKQIKRKQYPGTRSRRSICTLQDNPFKKQLDLLPPTPAQWQHTSERRSISSKDVIAPRRKSNEDSAVFKMPIMTPKSFALERRKTRHNRESSKYFKSPQCFDNEDKENTPISNKTTLHQTDIPQSYQYVQSPENNEDAQIFKIPEKPSFSSRRSRVTRRSARIRESTKIYSPGAAESSIYYEQPSFLVNNSMFLSPLNRRFNALEETVMQLEERIIQRLQSSKMLKREKTPNRKNEQSILDTSQYYSPLQDIANGSMIIESPQTKRQRRCSIRIMQKQARLNSTELCSTPAPKTKKTSQILRENEQKPVRKRGRKKVTKKPNEDLTSPLDKSVDKDLQQEHTKNILNILNKGDIKELKRLPSIGEKTAMVIRTWRHLHGPFANIQELKKVKGLYGSFYARFMVSNQLSDD